MMTEDMRLILSAVLGIAAAITLIVKARFHPFLALLCGAFLIGLLTGLPPAELAHAVEKGAGDVLGGTGLVVALGLSLGAMLQLSNGAEAVAQAGLRVSGPRAAPWMSMAVALLLGLPLFFETGLVLLLPIVAAAADGLSGGKDTSTMRLRLMLPALAGLSTLHALVPSPRPLAGGDGPARQSGADDVLRPAGRPAHGDHRRAAAGGHHRAACASFRAGDRQGRAAGAGAGPQRLADRRAAAGGADRAGQVKAVVPPAMAAHLGWTGLVSNPVFALVLANLAAMPLLFGRRMCAAPVQGAIWAEAMKPAGAIILAIGAGGALKQVLVTAGLADFLAHLASHGGIPAIPWPG
jgi:GntP family gluconate:H+ symporter